MKKLNITTPEKTIKIPSMRLSWVHLVAVLAIFLWIRSCERSNELEGQISSFNEVMNDTVIYYKNKNGDIVASKKALEGTKASLELMLATSRDSTKQLEGLVGYYKTVSAAAQITTETVIDTIEVPYIVEGEKFNIPFEIKEKWYSLEGNSRNDGLSIRNLTIPNQQSVVIGDKKSGFLRTEFRIDVVNSNPYIKTTEIDGFNLTQPKKRFGIGIYGGYGIGANGITPQIGVGLSYSLIRF